MFRCFSILGSVLVIYIFHENQLFHPIIQISLFCKVLSWIPSVSLVFVIIFPFWFLPLTVCPLLPPFFPVTWPVVYQFYWSVLLFVFADLHVSAIIFIASLINPFVRGSLRNIRDRKKEVKFSSKVRVCGGARGEVAGER